MFRSTPPHGERLRRSSRLLDLRRFDPRPRMGSDMAILSSAPGEFRSTPPHGERRVPLCRCGYHLCFDPRPRMGSDSPNGARATLQGFRSTPPHGERQAGERMCALRGFDPRPRMGSDFRDSGDAVVAVFRSTPPHGERLQITLQDRSASAVSIHAPAWGATRRGCVHSDREIVSIHAPAWGASGRAEMAARLVSCFDPRPRMGSDRARDAEQRHGCKFRSTPPHGERRPRSTAAWRRCFDPRPRMGSDPRSHINIASLHMFRSTPPHGERPQTAGIPIAALSFRSTPPHGERL